MAREFCVIEIKVLSLHYIGHFEGEAIMASMDPKYVVSAMICNTKDSYKIEHSNVDFCVYSAVNFAISSVAKVFMESNVIGNTYTMRVETDIIDGNTWYSLIRI